MHNKYDTVLTYFGKTN